MTFSSGRYRARLAMTALTPASAPVASARSPSPSSVDPDGLDPNVGLDPAMVRLWFDTIGRADVPRLEALLYDEPGLMGATEMGASALQRAAMADDGPLLYWLAGKGAAVDGSSARYRDHQTALHCASCFDKLNAVRVLIDLGANVGAADANGWTPLHRAASENHGTLVRLLLEHHAPQDVLNGMGETPLQTALAMRNDRVAALLQEAWTVHERSVLTATLVAPSAEPSSVRARARL